MKKSFAFFAVLFVACAALLCVSCGKKGPTPTQTFEGLQKALLAGDNDAAAEFLAPGLRPFLKLIPADTKKYIQSAKVTGEEVGDINASVTISYKNDKGATEEKTVRLSKNEKGKWVLAGL